MKRIYPINYRVREKYVQLWQLSKSEVAFAEKAKATKIDLDLENVNASTALKAVLDASAAKGFTFPISRLDALQYLDALKSYPITLHARQIDVDSALRTICYLGTILGHPREDMVGFDVEREDPAAAQKSTELRTAIEVVDRDAADVAGMAQLKAQIEQNLNLYHQLSGPSITGPAYPWTYRGKTYQPGTFVGMPATGGGTVGYSASGKTAMIDKTHIQIDLTLNIQDKNGKALGRITGRWTQPTRNIAHLLQDNQPVVVTLPDGTRKALFILVEAQLVDEDENALLPPSGELQDISLAGLTPPPTSTPNDSDETYFDEALKKDHSFIADSSVHTSTLKADAQMLQAIQKGDAVALKKVLDHAVDPNTFDPDRFNSTPAYWAVYFNQPECLKLLLAHFARDDGPTHTGSQPALDLAQRFHPDLVPILQDGFKRNRILLTALLTAHLHSIRIDLPAFSHVSLKEMIDFLLKATATAGYLERKVTIGNLNLPPSTTITSPAKSNITLWDALQTITSANNLRFDVDDESVGCITLYPPKDEVIIHPPAAKANAWAPTPAKIDARLKADKKYED